MAISEADTCRKYVLPKLYAAGWSDDQISEQKYFTDGRIFPAGKKHLRKPGKKADYLLKYRPDFPVAVVEAKSVYNNPGDGLQKALDYADILDLKFAYSTNGRGIVEHDLITGREKERPDFPSPDELWSRLRDMYKLKTDADAKDFLTPFNRELRNPDGTIKTPRYFQQIAIDRAIAAILQGRRRVLITMATGTGKTFVAVQIVWKLWKTRRKRRILYLADRNILVQQPLTREFSIFGDAVQRIQGDARKGREIYFALYQAIAEDSARPGLYKEYPRDFFDLIIVDECHRGSARDESSWRQILEYFDPATQIGMTATPLRRENRDTYQFGSMVEFKQIIGRGTRLATEYDKLWFAIIDYAGATRLFADPDFDGQPDMLTTEEIDANGDPIRPPVEPDTVAEPVDDRAADGPPELSDDSEPLPRKYVVVDGVRVAICAEAVYELDASGRRVRTVKYTEYAADQVHTLYSAAQLRKGWTVPEERAAIVRSLAERGVTLEDLARAANQPDADPLDLLLHLAWNAPLRSRRERADRLRKEQKAFFDPFTPTAREVLNDLLEKYAEHGVDQLDDLHVLEIPPVSNRGTVVEIAKAFGGTEKLKDAITKLQFYLYAS
jgi:type I site-specific restriction endonuclease